MKYTYWTKKGKFQTNDYNEIPWDDFHSSNEETPAFENSDGCKFWYFEGKVHRLSGPARIWPSGYKEFWLDGKRYEFNNWVLNHPDKTLLSIYLLKS